MFLYSVYLFIVNLCVLTLLYTQNDITEKALYPQSCSDSVVIVSGTNFINTDNLYKNIKGIPVTIDWCEIPNLGVPKNEIHTIQILKKQVAISNNTVISTPHTWKFKANNWCVTYTGNIPYLETLSFLPVEYKQNISTSNFTFFTQNSTGYLLDVTNKKSGLYNILNMQDSNSVSYIYIISKNDNKLIYDTQILLDENQDILSNEMSITTNIITNNIYKKIYTNTSNSYVDNTNKHTTPFFNNQKGLLEESIKTSIEKRNQYKLN